MNTATSCPLRLPAAAKFSGKDPACIAAIIQDKGGVGKTTTTVQFGNAARSLFRLAGIQAEVLTADFDASANASKSFFENLAGMVAEGPLNHDAYTLLSGRSEAREAIFRTEYGSIIPSSEELYGIDGMVGRQLGLMMRRAEKLFSGCDHQVVFIDTSADLRGNNRMAVAAADTFVLPLIENDSEVDGLWKTLDTALDWCQGRQRPPRIFVLPSKIGTALYVSSRERDFLRGIEDEINRRVLALHSDASVGILLPIAKLNGVQNHMNARIPLPLPRDALKHIEDLLDVGWGSNEFSRVAKSKELLSEELVSLAYLENVRRLLI